MSQHERNRLAVMVQVKQQKLSLVTAAQVMRVSYRQAKRVWRRYRQQGDAGLVHRSRGRASGRRKPAAARRRILDRYTARYPDFGPTLAAEYLAGEGLPVDHETLRRWRVAEGQWTVRRRCAPHRQWRERKPCFGQMLQLDGSHHEWFEKRGPKAVLMVLIDDATNRTEARFFPEETTRASYDTLEGWVRRHRLPAALYVDRDSIYRAEGLPSVADQLAGRPGPQTQFERAMKQLGIELKLAHSPQAKGRVERRHQVFQDRLVKVLRLEGIQDLATANRYLAKTFLPQLNRQFTVAAASPADVHRPVPRNLDEILSWEETRVVQRDWTVAWQRRWFQLDQQHARLSLAGRSITVRELRDGRVQLVHKGQKLRWRELPARPERPQVVRAAMGRTKVHRPAQTHPWRRYGAAARAAAPLPLGDGGRPPLRSGLPSSPKGKGGKSVQVNAG